MALVLDKESRLTRLRSWGVESGGLRAASILTVQLVFLIVASAGAWRPGVRVDVAALGVVFCALELSLLRGLVLTAAIGYLSDVFSGQAHGLWLAGALAAYAALRLFVFRVVGARAETVAGLCAFAAGVSGLVRVFLEGTLGPGVPTGTAYGLLTASVGSGVVGYPGYSVFRWASDRFRDKDEQTFH